MLTDDSRGGGRESPDSDKRSITHIYRYYYSIKAIHYLFVSMKAIRSSSSLLVVQVALLLLGATSPTTAAFFQNLNQPKTAAPNKSSPQADQAVQIFNAKFPFDRPPLKPNRLLSLGMPNNYSQQQETRGKRLSDITEAEARATFAELARLYGADEALQMTKAKPIVLSFKVQYETVGTVGRDGKKKWWTLLVLFLLTIFSNLFCNIDFECQPMLKKNSLPFEYPNLFCTNIVWITLILEMFHKKSIL